MEKEVNREARDASMGIPILGQGLVGEGLSRYI